MKINWKKIESVLADIFKVSTGIADGAEQIVDIVNPGIGAVYNLSVNAAIQAEEAADEAAAKETTNAAKLVAITEAVAPYLVQAAAQAGVAPPTQAHIAAYAQSVLNGLEVLSVNATPTTTT
jgi:Na+-transporting methylmalonyl-CoA/oxaloacetate decarboxylase gamma subunit